MRYFKKFGDFCTGFTCFIIIIYLFRSFMQLESKIEDTGLLDNLRDFFSPLTAYGNILAAVLVIMLIISVAASVIFKRIPFICPLFLLPPLLLSVDMVRSSYLTDYPMLCVLLLGIAFISAVFECIRLDAIDKKRRTCICGALTSLFFAAYLWWLYDKARALLESDTGETVAPFDFEVLFGAKNMNIKILAILALVYAALAIVGLILRDIYFIDALLVIAPTVALIYLWSAGIITFHEEVIVAFGVAVFAARIIPAFSGKAFVRKKN